MDPTTTRPALNTIDSSRLQLNRSRLPTLSTRARKTCGRFVDAADSTIPAEAPFASKRHGVDLGAPAWQSGLRDRINREANGSLTDEGSGAL